MRILHAASEYSRRMAVPNTPGPTAPNVRLGSAMAPSELGFARTAWVGRWVEAILRKPLICSRDNPTHLAAALLSPPSFRDGHDRAAANLLPLVAAPLRRPAPRNSSPKLLTLLSKWIPSSVTVSGNVREALCVTVFQSWPCSSTDGSYPSSSH